jgi:methylthioribose-1-phosphate isomerase
MAGYYFSRGEIDCVVVGADRIARNGDVANKIGTYSHACLAHLHQRPFYVAAPTSTLDPNCATGAEIPIENRSSLEVVQLGSHRIAPVDAIARHPGFDVTPNRYITKIFTEKGVFEPQN